MSRFCSVALIAAVWLAPGLAAGRTVPQSQPAKGPDKGYKAYSDRAGRFSLFYPEDWKLVAGARALLLTITSKDLKSVVVVEVQRQEIARTEITPRLMENEAGDLKDRQPDATGVKPSSAKIGKRTMLVIDYSRPGINGDEQLRQHSIYEGLLLLRVTCIRLATAKGKELQALEGFFQKIVESVEIPARPAGGGSIDR
jgi:hypothetical protein